MDCDYARCIQNSLNVDILTVSQNFNFLQAWAISWFTTVEQPQNEHEEYVIKLMSNFWYIWKDRCNLIFQDTFPNRSSTISRIQLLLKQCSLIANDANVLSNCSPLIKEWIPP